MAKLLNNVFGMVPKDLLEKEKRKSRKLIEVLIDASVELKVSADMIKIWMAGDVDDECREVINEYLASMLKMNEKILECLRQSDRSEI